MASKFNWLDYTLFVATIAVSLAIGIYKSFSKHSRGGGTSDYLIGSRQMGLFPVSLSIIMSRISSISVLGNTAETYLHGTQLSLISLAVALGYLISCFILVPVIYRLGITSAFEYYDLRFNSKVLRRMTSFLEILLFIFYAGSCAYAPSVALAAVTNLPLWVGIVSTVVAGTIYTATGGIRAVIWTDAFQALLFFLGLFVIMVVGIMKVGGLAEVLRISSEGGRIQFFNMNPDPTIKATFWSTLLPYLFENITAASYQTTLQRIQSCESENQAKLAVFIQAHFWIIMKALVLLCGLTIYAYYEKEGCDPFRSSQIDSPNQLLSLFIVDVLDAPGIPGLFLAVLFSGSLSSISSVLNSCVGLTLIDFILPLFPDLTEKKQFYLNRLLSVGYGMLMIIVSLFIASFRGHILQIFMSVSGALYSPIAGLFFLGVIFPWVQWKGAFIGLLSGFSLAIWINIGKQLQPYHKSFLSTNISDCQHPYNDTTWSVPVDTPAQNVFVLYRLSFLWISFIGWLTTVVVGLIASLLTGPQDPDSLNPDTLVPWNDIFRWRRRPMEPKRTRDEKKIENLTLYEKGNKDNDFLLEKDDDIGRKERNELPCEENRRFAQDDTLPMEEKDHNTITSVKL